MSEESLLSEPPSPVITDTAFWAETTTFIRVFSHKMDGHLSCSLLGIEASHLSTLSTVSSDNHMADYGVEISTEEVEQSLPPQLEAKATSASEGSLRDSHRRGSLKTTSSRAGLPTDVKQLQQMLYQVACDYRKERERRVAAVAAKRDLRQECKRAQADLVHERQQRKALEHSLNVLRAKGCSLRKRAVSMSALLSGAPSYIITEDRSSTTPIDTADQPPITPPLRKLSVISIDTSVNDTAIGTSTFSVEQQDAIRTLSDMLRAQKHRNTALTTQLEHQQRKIDRLDQKLKQAEAARPRPQPSEPKLGQQLGTRTSTNRLSVKRRPFRFKSEATADELSSRSVSNSSQNSFLSTRGQRDVSRNGSHLGEVANDTIPAISYQDTW